LYLDEPSKRPPALCTRGAAGARSTSSWQIRALPYPIADRMRRERMMNPKCLGRNVPDTFDARSADFTGLKMRRITRAASFDHLVGKNIHLGRDRDTKRVRRITVDHQIESGWLLDRQIARARTFEYLVHVSGCAPVELEKASAIAHHSADFCKFSLLDQGRQPLPQGELRNPLTLAEQKPVRYTKIAPTFSRLSAANAVSTSSGLRASTGTSVI